MYIWEETGWPDFKYDLTHLKDLLNLYISETSYISGSLDHLPENVHSEALVDLMVSESIKTFEIEGEKINMDDVRSSIRHQLGLTDKPELLKDPRAEGIAKLMIANRKNYTTQLTKEELFSWHTMIMTPSIYLSKEEIGAWRTDTAPMRIVSGALGKETIHYEAPPSTRVPSEMSRFIDWFNGSTDIPGPVRAAVAHLYFEIIHPFSDGNGRIGRALCEKSLFQGVDRPLLISLSTAIEKRKKTYYEELSIASKNGLNITGWIEYFVRIIHDAILESKIKIRFVVQKAKFWNQFEPTLNERQTKVLKKMLSEGLEGFKGDITTKKYLKIAPCSKATATRDLRDLVQYGCLQKLPGGGRSTRYRIILPNIDSNNNEI